MKISFQTEKQKNPTKNDGFKVVYAPAKRFAFKIRWYFLLALIISPVVIFGWYMFNQKVLITADGILTSDPIILVATEEGFIRSINVSRGDKVQTQQNLLHINSPILMKEKELLSRNFAFFSSNHKEGLDSIRALYKSQIESYKNSEMSQRLINSNIEAFYKVEVLPLKEKLSIEQTNSDARGRYQQALINFGTAIIEHTNGDLAKTLLDIERSLLLVETKQEMLNITSPKIAVINDIMVKEGQFVNKGDALISISNLSKPVVHVYVKPSRMDYVEIGQTASITLPNGDKYEGIVNTPTQLSEKLPDVLSGPFKDNQSAIKVTLDIDPAPEFFLEGLPVKVRFHYSVETSNFDMNKLYQWFGL